MGSYGAMKFWIFLRIKMCKKIHMISLQDSEDLDDNVHNEITITKHLVTCTMLVDRTVHPDYWSYTG